MPFQDVINSYANGATGTLTDVNGDPVGYTVTGTSPTVNWLSMQSGAMVNANGTQSFTVTFDHPVVGAAIRFSGSDANEHYFVTIDGVAVNLQTLIANGDVTLTQSGAATHVIRPNGSIAGGNHTDASVADLVFHIPVSSIGSFGTNGSAGNWDFVEVGIDPTQFNTVCFTAGTMIDTPLGPRPVEDLRVGDVLPTAQNGLKTIRWIGSRPFSAMTLREVPRLRPVRIMGGALGNGLPKRDLVVSRQHRVVVSSRIAYRMFGSRDVMIPAIALTELPGIFVENNHRDIVYFHVLLDGHEAIRAEGVWCESLYLGKEAKGTFSIETLNEIAAIFPGLSASGASAELAMPTAQGQFAAKLVQRHTKNRMPLQNPAPFISTSDVRHCHRRL